MASPSLVLPGVLYAGEDNRARLVAHVGPAAGWMSPKGILQWSREVSVVLRDALTEEVKRATGAVMPHEQIPPARCPLTHDAARRAPLVAVASKLTPKLVEAGVRVHTVGVDSLTSGFFYIAEGGGEDAVQVHGDLVHAVADALGHDADNAAIDRTMDGLLDRLLRALSRDRVTELAVELAASLPRLAADGSGSQGVDIEAFERDLRELVGRSEKYAALLQDAADKLAGASGPRVEVPLYAEARKVSLAAVALTISGHKTSLPAYERWVLSGPFTEPGAAPKAEAKPAEAKPAEAKPAEAKPVEAKPVETKPAAAKPVEAKPVEAKPVETKPAAAKPVEAKPAATKPVEAKPVEVKPVKATPPEVKSAPAAATAKRDTPQPAEAKPAAAKPAAAAAGGSMKKTLIGGVTPTPPERPAAARAAEATPESARAPSQVIPMPVVAIGPDPSAPEAPPPPPPAPEPAPPAAEEIKAAPEVQAEPPKVEEPAAEPAQPEPAPEQEAEARPEEAAPAAIQEAPPRDAEAREEGKSDLAKAKPAPEDLEIPMKKGSPVVVIAIAAAIVIAIVVYLFVLKR